MKKIILAGLLGGVVMFIWGAISHMVLPIGMMGIKSLPNEDTVLAALKPSVPESGLYFFPGMPASGKMTEAEQKAWEAKLAAGPTGLLVYTSHGSKPLEARQLLLELATNIVAALILAFVFSQTAGTVICRASMGAAFGLFAWFSISASHWIWYNFPAAYAFGEALDQTIGWLLAGAAMSLLMRSKSPANPAAAPA